MALATALLGGSGLLSPANETPQGAKYKSLAEWRALTAASQPIPRVFIRGNNARFYFQSRAEVQGFKAEWGRSRIPSPDYRVHTALLDWDEKLPRIPQPGGGWREAKVISGTEWEQIAATLVGALTPEAPLHAVFYQAFLADGVLYRDRDGRARLAELGREPADVVIDRRYSIEQTLEILAREIEKRLAASHPGERLFLIMAPNARRHTQPLLLDRDQKRCVWFTPSVLYDTTEGGFPLRLTAESASALLLEGHGIALVKNPVSSIARLGDMGVQTGLRFLRRPLPRRIKALEEPGTKAGMDLVAWEKWLDTYTGTRCERGSLQLLIGGDRFFPRLSEAMREATNYVHANLYVFDKDDFAVAVADELKLRSKEVEVRLVIDRMGSLAAGVSPPGTPMPEDFTPPESISRYLENGSEVGVRKFLNPWFSSHHSKVLIVDGAYAWLGGMNIGREYRYEWHDLMVELQGPVVGTLDKEFRRVWAHAGPWGDLSYLAELTRRPAAKTNGSWGSVRLLPTRTGWKPFGSAVLGSLRKAQNHVYVAHPYLFDKRVLIGLVDARRRGVDVRVVFPRVNDFIGGTRSNVVTANYLLKHGVRVYFYPGMTHAKALLVDGWACVGSANLNNLSMRLCQEQNVATSDPVFTEQLRAELFEREFSMAYELKEPLAVGYVDFLVDLVLESF